ncbi:MAG: NAD(P)/FAD-dependent oxidoreductase [Lachnospiraceae bacterium]|nr:NAD(P)/FAD-dependent oxidoreductase [Lachnospiraceae bacterium]
MIWDVVIIGAGIIGCAVARELSRYDASILVLEAGSDVAEGATKANSGIIHAGFDAASGSLKARYNVMGAHLYKKYCEELGAAYSRCGALVIALEESEKQKIHELYKRGMENGVQDLRMIDRDAVLQMEPDINPDVVCALYAPAGAIVSPYEIAFAAADDAAVNGVSFAFEQRVRKVSGTDSLFRIQTEKNSFSCRAVINCAGTGSAEIHNQLSADKLKMTYRRGQYYLLDRAEKQPFSHTIFQCPSKMGKGVLITPTVHGNLIIGPNAEDIDRPLDTSTTSRGLEEVIGKAKRTWPHLSVRTNITNFSGIRAHLETGDFVVGAVDGADGAFEAVGIESPGLSCAPAIGIELCARAAAYLKLEKKENVIRYTRSGKAFHDMTDSEREEAVRNDPLHGNIVCRCEMVTEAEIREAIHRPVGAKTIDAVKRRTRAGMGRCQGGFCSPRVASIISEETGIPLQNVTKNGGESYLLKGSVKEFLERENESEEPGN